MRKDPNYSIYYINLCRLIILGIIPFTLLTFYNCAIYKRICQTSKFVIEENISKRLRRNQETDLAKVLFAIVALCIVCHTLRFFLNFYEMIWINDIISCTGWGLDGFPRWSYIVHEFSRLLLILNSSINIVIYCCFNAKFRKQVIRYKSTISEKLALRSMSTKQGTIEEDVRDSIVEIHSIQEKT